MARGGALALLRGPSEGSLAPSPPDAWLPHCCRYRQSPDNDLAYWGLDYPPLSGYQVWLQMHRERDVEVAGSSPLPWTCAVGAALAALLQSWLHGKLVRWLEPAAVTLHSSRGYESEYSKLAMRWTVLLTDVLCYFPATVAAALVFGSGAGLPQQVLLLVNLLLSPGLVLIDHGHFQYNCISLGAAAGAAAAAVAGQEVLSAVLFSLSLNHKQMSLYLAPAFFAYLLGRCLQRTTLPGKVSHVVALEAVGGVLCWWSDVCTANAAHLLLACPHLAFPLP